MAIDLIIRTHISVTLCAVNAVWTERRVIAWIVSNWILTKVISIDFFYLIFILVGCVFKSVRYILFVALAATILWLIRRCFFVFVEIRYLFPIHFSKSISISMDFSFCFNLRVHQFLSKIQEKNSDEPPFYHAHHSKPDSKMNFNNFLP